MRNRCRLFLPLLVALLLGVLHPLAALAATGPCTDMSRTACPAADCCQSQATGGLPGCAALGCAAVPMAGATPRATAAVRLARATTRPAWDFVVRTSAPVPAIPPPRADNRIL